MRSLPLLAVKTAKPRGLSLVFRLFCTAWCLLWPMLNGGAATDVSNPGGDAVAWADDGDGATDVPSGLNNVVAIAGGVRHGLALLQQPPVPTPRLALSRGLSGLDLRPSRAPGISCQLLRASKLPGPWLPTEPVTFTDGVQPLRAPDPTEPAQFFHLLVKVEECRVFPFPAESIVFRRFWT
jgi:hypothetical protein